MDITEERDHKPTRVGGMRRYFEVAAIVAGTALGLGPAAVAAAPLPSPGCLDGGESARVTAVGGDFSLVLADGRGIAMPGVDAWRPADDPGAVAAVSALSAWLPGRNVAVRTLAAAPDRWGRTPGLVFAEPPASGPRISVAEALLGAGLARARPDPRIAACWAVFLSAEREARSRGLGLWKEPRYAVIAADDRARLLASTGSMAIVEGRIVRIVDARARMYLGFGASRSDFSITVAKSVGARWRETGIDPGSWKGRTARVRGFLDDRFGLQIELTSLDQVEFPDAEEGAKAMPGR